jgi:hypothetical protein
VKDDDSVIFYLCREENMKIVYTIRQLGTATAPHENQEDDRICTHHGSLA